MEEDDGTPLTIEKAMSRHKFDWYKSNIDYETGE
jgi:hypothetical protein